MLFSVLIPSIPSRSAMLSKLYEKLSYQVGAEPVEILSLLDNKQRSIGLKRDALMQIARGDFVAFVDDDDDVSPDYIDTILKTIRDHPDADLIVFKQYSSINGGNQFIVDFDIAHSNEEAQCLDGVWQNIKRQPFHVCVWKAELAKLARFPDMSYGEDWAWARQLIPSVHKQIRINKVLHTYVYDDRVTEAKSC